MAKQPLPRAPKRPQIVRNPEVHAPGGFKGMELGGSIGSTNGHFEGERQGDLGMNAIARGTEARSAAGRAIHRVADAVYLGLAGALIAACGTAGAEPRTTPGATTPSTAEATTTSTKPTTTPEVTTPASVVPTTTPEVPKTGIFPYEVIPLDDVAVYDPTIEWAWASEDTTQTSIPQHIKMYNFNGEFLIPIPNNGTYPIKGTNPNNPEAINMEQYMLLPDGTEICIRGGAVGGGDANYTVYERTVTPFEAPSAVVFQSLSYGVPTAILAILVKDKQGAEFILDAAENGLISFPSEIFSPLRSVEEGTC